jgi:hypothetical protein
MVLLVTLNQPPQNIEKTYFTKVAFNHFYTYITVIPPDIFSKNILIAVP